MAANTNDNNIIKDQTNLDIFEDSFFSSIPVLSKPVDEGFLPCILVCTLSTEDNFLLGSCLSGGPTVDSFFFCSS